MIDKHIWHISSSLSTLPTNQKAISKEKVRTARKAEAEKDIVAMLGFLPRSPLPHNRAFAWA